MTPQKRKLFNLTKFELGLWLSSISVIIISTLAVGSVDYLSLIASLIGATSLIFISKGNVIGQFLIIAFSIFYGVISYIFRYYGEMITYVFLNAPISIISIVAWLKNQNSKEKLEVKINTLKPKELIFMLVLSIVVTVVFYFILRYFDTRYLVISTISIFTSFVASYFSIRRSVYFLLAFCANDIVLIIMWVLASVNELKYISMVICFVVFLINDLYGFINWSRIKKRQLAELSDL